MKLSSTINTGLLQNLDRLCSSTANTYLIKNKITDLNDALDWYFQIGFKAGMNWELDDSNNSLPPIDTQNLVSGTNRYKVSSFTEKVINLIKLEVDDSTGKGWELTPETMEDLTSSFDDLYLDPDSGVPTHYIKYGDFIYLRPVPDYNAASGLRVYFNRPADKFEFVSCSVSNANPAVVTATAHGLTTNDTFIFEVDTGGTLNTGLTADQQYYVLSTDLTADTFKFSATEGGSAVATSSTGSGVHFLKTSGEPGINSMHHLNLVKKAALTFRSLPDNAGSQAGLQGLFAEVARAEKEIGDYFGGRDKDLRKRVMPVQLNNK